MKLAFAFLALLAVGAASGRRLLASDELCSNAANTAYDCLAENNNFSLLVELIDAANLTRTLQSKAQEMTVLAPTDDVILAALEAVGNITIPELLTQGGDSILAYHVGTTKMAYGFIPKGSSDFVQTIPTLLTGHSFEMIVSNPADGNGKSTTTVVGELNNATATLRTVKGKAALYAVDKLLLPSIAQITA